MIPTSPDYNPRSRYRETTPVERSRMAWLDQQIAQGRGDRRPARKLDLSVEAILGDWREHGILATYGLGCRCELCREAKAKWRRERK